jgi:hypothetical protein
MKGAAKVATTTEQTYIDEGAPIATAADVLRRELRAVTHSIALMQNDLEGFESKADQLREGLRRANLYREGLLAGLSQLGEDES